MIYISSQDNGAERTHQESRTEGHQGQHQRGEFIAGREEGAGDVGGVVAEHLKIVGFEKVAAGHAQDRPELRSGHVTRSTAPWARGPRRSPTERGIWVTQLRLLDQKADRECITQESGPGQRRRARTTSNAWQGPA